VTESDAERPPRPLWVRWTVLIVFVVLLGTAFVLLGRWQLARLDERRIHNEQTIANERAPVRPYTDVFTRPIVEADQWQRVEATGVFDAEHQFVVRFRSGTDPGGNEAKGYEVVTPLRTEAGWVLVDRGFIAVPNTQELPSVAPAPPTGRVRVVGHVRRNEEGGDGAIKPNNGQVRLINAPALATALPYPVADGYIGAITVDPPQQGDLSVVQLPELSEGPHFWYAVQWFMFTGIGITGIVVFIRGDLRERKTRDHAASPGGKNPPGPKA
jgi:cytochrome oxidase assembly protein ShyY1